MSAAVSSGSPAVKEAAAEVAADSKVTPTLTPRADSTLTKNSTAAGNEPATSSAASAAGDSKTASVSPQRRFFSSLEDAGLKFIPLPVDETTELLTAEDDQLEDLFIGQLSCQFTANQIAAMLNQLCGHQTVSHVALGAKPCCAFVTTLAIDVPQILNFAKFVLCDREGVWLAENAEQQAELEKLVHEKSVINQTRDHGLSAADGYTRLTSRTSGIPAHTLVIERPRNPTAVKQRRTVNDVPSNTPIWQVSGQHRTNPSPPPYVPPMMPWMMMGPAAAMWAQSSYMFPPNQNMAPRMDPYQQPSHNVSMGYHNQAHMQSNQMGHMGNQMNQMNQAPYYNMNQGMGHPQQQMGGMNQMPHPQMGGMNQQQMSGNNRMRH